MTQRNPAPGPPNEPANKPPRSVDTPLDPPPSEESQRDPRSPVERNNDEYPLDPDAPERP